MSDSTPSHPDPETSEQSPEDPSGGSTAASAAPEPSRPAVPVPPPPGAPSPTAEFPQPPQPAAPLGPVPPPPAGQPIQPAATASAAAPSYPVPPSPYPAVPGPVQPGAAQSAVQRALAPLATGPGLVSLAITTGIVLGAALVSAVLFFMTVQASGLTGVDISFSMFPLVMGVTLGGHVVVSETARTLSATIGISVLPLGTLLAAGVGVGLAARRRVDLDGSRPASIGPLCVRAAVEAAAVGVVTCLLCCLSSVTPDEDASISASAPWTFALVWLVVFVALVWARGSRSVQALLPTALRQVLTELAAVTTVAGVVIGGVTVIGAIFAALKNDAGGSLFLLPVFLPNLALYVLSLGSLGSVTVSGSSSAVFGFDLDDVLADAGDAYAWTIMGGWWVLLLIVMIAFMVFAAARVGVHRRRTGRAELARTWPLGAAGLVAGVVLLNLLLPIRVSGNALGKSLSASAGPAWYAGFTLGIVALIISVLAEYVPVWLYTSAHALLVRCAGASAVSAWLMGTSGCAATAPASSSQPQSVPAPQTDTATFAPVPPAAPVPGSQTPAAPMSVAAPGAAPVGTSVGDTGGISSAADNAAVVPAPPAQPAPPPPLAQPPEPAGAVVDSPPPPPVPTMSARSRRRVKVGLGVLGVVVVLGIVGLVTLNVVNSRRGPDKEVEAYLNLVAEGKAQAANDMVDPGVPNSQRALLTDAVLGSATSRITSIDVGKPHTSGDSATVTATFSLDGQRIERSFTATKRDSTFGLLDTWKIQDSLASPVTLSSGAFDTLVVGGQEIELTSDEQSGSKGSGYSEYSDSYTGQSTQYVYPGIYDVAADSSRSKYLTADTTSLKVGDTSSGSSSASSTSGSTIEVEGQATQDLKDVVLKAVKDKAISCVTPPTNLDTDCPSAVQSRHLSYMDVTSQPTDVTMDSSATSFKSGKIVVTVRDEATTWNKNPSDRKDAFTFSGTVEWPKGQQEPKIEITGASTSYD